MKPAGARRLGLLSLGTEVNVTSAMVMQPGTCVLQDLRGHLGLGMETSVRGLLGDDGPGGGGSGDNQVDSRPYGGRSSRSKRWIGMEIEGCLHGSGS